MGCGVSGLDQRGTDPLSLEGIKLNSYNKNN